MGGWAGLDGEFFGRPLHVHVHVSVSGAGRRVLLWIFPVVLLRGFLWALSGG